MVQSEVADRLAAPPGSKVYGVPSVKAAWYADVRRAGCDRPQRLLAGAERRLRPGRLDPPRPARRPPSRGRRSSRSSTPRSPSAARRCAPPSRGWPAPRRPPRRPSRAPASTRWPAASARRRASSRGSPRASTPVTRPPSARVTVRAPAKINLAPRRRRGRAPTASTRSPRSTRRSACTTRSRVADGRRRDGHRHRRGRDAWPTYRSTGPTSRSAPPGCSPRHHGVDRGVAHRHRTRASRSPAAWPAAARTPPRRCWPATAVGPAAPRDEDLLALAAELGSDVPFALVGGTAHRHRPRRARDAADDPRRRTGGWSCRVRRGPVHARRSTASSTGCTPARRSAHAEIPDELIAGAARPATPRRWAPRCATTSRRRRSACVPSSAERRRWAVEYGARRGAVRLRPELPVPLREPRRTRPGVAAALREAGLRVVPVAHRPGRRRPPRPEGSH